MSKKNKKKLIESILILIVAFFTIYYNDISINLSKSNFQNREIQETTKIINNNNLKIYFLDVGQADSILIENNNEYMLIDAGNNEDGLKLVNYFNSLGITNFKIVIGTHAHEDHIGGLDDIIKNFSIESFYMPEVITTTKTFEDVLDALEEKQVAFQTPTLNEELNFEETRIEILNVEDNSSDLNDTSIVLRLEYGTTSFLFMGDASSKIEQRILNENIRSDVLKVSHHGSTGSTTLSFLKKVSPTYAVISVGKDNIYKHPSSTIINRLNKNNVKVYRTDEQGTIVAESNGTIINFSNIKTETNG